MRKFWHIVVSQALLALVLVATMGVPLRKMTCLHSGKQKVALFDVTSCCPQPDGCKQPGISNGCCVVSSELLKVEAQVTPQADEQLAVAYGSELWGLASQPSVQVPSTADALHFADLPPPPIPPSDLCVAHQVFRI